MNSAADNGSIVSIACGHVVIESEFSSAYENGEMSKCLEYTVSKHTRSLLFYRVTAVQHSVAVTALVYHTVLVFDGGTYTGLYLFADDEAFVIQKGYEGCSSLTFISLDTAVEPGPELVSASFLGKRGGIESKVWRVL